MFQFYKASTGCCRHLGFVGIGIFEKRRLKTEDKIDLKLKVKTKFNSSEWIGAEK